MTNLLYKEDSPCVFTISSCEDKILLCGIKNSYASLHKDSDLNSKQQKSL